MKMMIRAGLATLFFALAGCSGMGHPALVGGGEPHALLEIMMAGDVSETQYPAKLEKIDGAQLVQGNRRAFRVAPGEHEVSLSLDAMALARYETGRGNQVRVSSMSADVREKTVTVNLEAGKTYKFGAFIEGYRFEEWQPFVATVAELEKRRESE